MLNFEPIRKEKISEYNACYADAEGIGCECSFVNGYLWTVAYRLRVAFFDGTLIKAYFRDDNRVWGYCLPHGRNVAGAVEAVFADAAERGQTVRFAYMNRRERDYLEELFPNRFSFRLEQENRDYIYSTRDLALLPGKKYHSKRNHISKFYRTYGGSVRFSAIDQSNISDALLAARLWCEENGIVPEKHAEYAVIKKACEDFDYLGMRGAVLYAGGRPVAMTMGSEISGRCFDVMFEKGLRSFDGVYAVINNEFAKTLTDYRYINREEDLGLEGLRRSKLSYHPEIIYERFSADEIQNGN